MKSQNQNLSVVHGGKPALQNKEKDLIDQVAEALTIVHGGYFKVRKRSA